MVPPASMWRPLQVWRVGGLLLLGYPGSFPPGGVSGLRQRLQAVLEVWRHGCPSIPSWPGFPSPGVGGLRRRLQAVLEARALLAPAAAHLVRHT